MLFSIVLKRLYTKLVVASLTEDVGEAWLCVGCKKEFKDPNSRLLECERCADHYCTRCMKINDAEYDFLNARNDIPVSYTHLTLPTKRIV